MKSFDTKLLGDLLQRIEGQNRFTVTRQLNDSETKIGMKEQMKGRVFVLQNFLDYPSFTCKTELKAESE
ncbi:MAG: hypothetical protein FWF53_07555 [Candidatus Azobacteroides sp.]|nr:hypothetical protein [Candidatus Azobacteroides sp.]